MFVFGIISLIHHTTDIYAFMASTPQSESRQVENTTTTPRHGVTGGAGGGDDAAPAAGTNRSIAAAQNGNSANMPLLPSYGNLMQVSVVGEGRARSCTVLNTFKAKSFKMFTHL